MNRIVSFAGPAPRPALIHAAANRTGIRFLGVLRVGDPQPAHVARACTGRGGYFLAWRAAAAVGSIAAMRPLHAAAWIER
jgi:hypothetical protein